MAPPAPRRGDDALREYVIRHGSDGLLFLTRNADEGCTTSAAGSPGRVRVVRASNPVPPAVLARALPLRYRAHCTGEACRPRLGAIVLCAVSVASAMLQSRLWREGFPF